MKKLKHRKYVIQELISTEEQYCKNLSIILKEIKIPTLERKILTKEESNQIFSVLDEIQNFHSFFSEKLKKSFENFDNRKTKIGEVVFKVLQPFKMYYLYCDNFKIANSRLDKMRKENHKFINFIKQLEYTPLLQNLDLSSHLVKPVQRLPKYVLLFKDLKKNTDEKHPDYENISKCLDEFSKMNSENNQKINDHIFSIKIRELDKKFGTADKCIVSASRQFRSEEPINILSEDMPKPVICFFFTDLLLVVDELQSQVVKYLELDENTLVKDLPNTKYFKWLFSVTGKEPITIIAENLETKKKLFDDITKIVNEIKEKVAIRDKAKNLLEVSEKRNIQFNMTVIGSLKRGIQHFKPVTMYIVLIQFGPIVTRMYYRFSELSKLNELINAEFPAIKIENLPKKHWWRAQKTKIIESRKILIENFLNSIFSHEELNQNLKILGFLGLAENDETVFSESFIEKSNLKNQNTYLDLLESEKKVGKSSIFSYFLKMENYSLFSKSSFLFLSVFKGLEETRIIKVRLCNDEYVTININKYTKAFEACVDIAKQIQLLSHLDFKLFLSNDEDERLIDNEECLCQVLDYDPNKINEDLLMEMLDKEKNQGFMAKIKDQIFEQVTQIKKNWEDMCFCKYELVYKKYIFFPNDWEKRDLKRDPVRLNLVTNQIFNDVMHSRYKLSFDEYSLVAGLRCYIQFGKFEGNIEKDSILFEKMRNFLPKLILYLKTKKFWTEKIGFFWKKISDEIAEIYQINNKFNNTSHLKNKRKKVDNLKNIAEFCGFNFFKKIDSFGERLFWVTSKKNPENMIKLIENFLWIGLTFTSLTLLSPEGKNEMFKIDIDKITNTSSFPNSFSFIYEENEFSFYTNSSHELVSLIREYSSMAKDLKRKSINSKRN